MPSWFTLLLGFIVPSIVLHALTARYLSTCSYCRVFEYMLLLQGIWVHALTARCLSTCSYCKVFEYMLLLQGIWVHALTARYLSTCSYCKVFEYINILVGDSNSLYAETSCTYSVRCNVIWGTPNVVQLGVEPEGSTHCQYTNEAI